MLSGDVKKISPTGEPVLRFLNPLQILIHLWQYSDLIRQLTWREVAGRYRGSFIGLGWSFIHPLIMLSVYTFVFSEVFKAKWGMEPDEGVTAFGLALFMGLITFNIFSEVISSAPSLILAHTSYVKKVVFPLEILVVVKLLSALINALFSLSVLIIGFLILNHFLHWTLVILPIIWLPMMMFTLGCGYFLASLGVFVRDLGTSVGIVTSMLFFLTPIFYPARAVPEAFRFICLINPMAVFIEDSRKAVLWGIFPDWQWFFLGLLLSLLIFILGFLWFMKTKKAFADVI